jgi:hypothetical protein
LSTLKFSTDVSENIFPLYNQELKNIKLEHKNEIEKEVDRRNQAELAGFLAKTQGLASLVKPKVNQARAQQILELLKANPIAGSEHIKNYDADREVGFCFGRATYVHMELLRRKVLPEHIVKIFALGNLRSRNEKWEFHVVIAVLGSENTWWVIDELSKDILNLKDWMDQFKAYSKNPKEPRIRYYITDAAKFHPALGAYKNEELRFEYYNNYFVDLEKWFEKNPVQDKDFSSWPP